MFRTNKTKLGFKRHSEMRAYRPAQPAGPAGHPVLAAIREALAPAARPESPFRAPRVNRDEEEDRARTAASAAFIRRACQRVGSWFPGDPNW